MRPALPTLVLLFALAGAPLRAQTLPAGLTVETLAPSLSAPVALEFLPDGRVLFAEQFTGRVRLFTEGAGVQAVPVLELPDVVAGGERGLLGLALDWRFPTQPYLYVFHDAPNPNHIRISRYTLSGGLDPHTDALLTASLATRFDLLDAIPDAAANHNGGTLRFGPDGKLYASLGDDAAPCAAPDLTSLRGKILRLEVTRLADGPGLASFAQLTPADNPYADSPDSAARLVVASGLRNPFRFQVDMATGTLVIADVGESLREELDLLQPLSATGGPFPGDGGRGADFGWPYFEGTAAGAHRNECPPPPPVMVAPVYEYDRTAQLGGAAIIAAGLYRPRPGGSRSLPAEYALSLFASDYYSGAMVRLVQGGGSWQVAAPVPGQPDAAHWAEGFHEVSDWRIGPDGALWFCRQSVDFAGGTGSLGRVSGPLATPAPESTRPSLRVLGSPAVGEATFSCTGIAADAVLRVLDTGGRLVRRYRADEFAAAPEGARVTWDGRDAGGRAVRPGLYLARLESAGGSASARVPFLR